nr:MAG TPA: hypothetical protein [Caudoviricetes sp.]
MVFAKKSPRVFRSTGIPSGMTMEAFPIQSVISA